MLDNLLCHAGKLKSDLRVANAIYNFEALFHDDHCKVCVTGSGRQPVYLTS